MNKTAIITGGTKGIGYALIKKFAAEGFDIVTCSRHQKELDVLKSQISTNFKVKVITATTDVSNKDEVVAFGNLIKKECASVDVLINNAGVFIPGQVHAEADGVLETMIDTNLYSAYHLTRQLISLMMDNKQGHIFNICSTASTVAYANGGSYCISKFAMLGFSKVLREEMKEHHVRVTSVMPGATMSASWEGVDLPEERFMKADDVAETVYNAYNMSDRTVIEEIIMRPQLGDI